MANITPKQSKTARSLLKWNLHDLVNFAKGLQPRRVESFEKGLTRLLGWENNEIIRAYKDAGIVFKSDLEVILEEKAPKIMDNNYALNSGKVARIVLDAELRIVSDSSSLVPGETDLVREAKKLENEKPE